MNACTENPTCNRTILQRDAQGEPWLLALRRLHANKWRDSEIAEALEQLSAADILLMERHGLWKKRDIESCMHVGAGQPWTKRRVEIARRQLGLRGHRKKRSKNLRDSLHLKHLNAAIFFARSEGWGHLVGQQELILQMQGKGWSLERIAEELEWPVELLAGYLVFPWDVLWPHEALVLSSLDTFGPQTLPALRSSVAGLAMGQGLKGRPVRLEYAGHDRRDRLLGRLSVRNMIHAPDRFPTRGRWLPVWSLTPWMRRRPTRDYFKAERLFKPAQLP